MSEREKAEGLKAHAERLLNRARLWFRLRRYGVRKPFLVAEEADREQVPLHYALALLEKETGIPQRNVFGCDWGAGEAFCHQTVTKARVAALLASGKANGVGWTQLTWPDFVREADKEGGAHLPRSQCRVAFRVLRQNFDRMGSWQLAFRTYNGSGAAAEAYGREAITFARRWEHRLAGLDH